MKHQLQSHWQKCTAVSAAFDSRLVGPGRAWCIKITLKCNETTNPGTEQGVYVEVNAYDVFELKGCAY